MMLQLLANIQYISVESIQYTPVESLTPILRKGIETWLSNCRDMDSYLSIRYKAIGTSSCWSIANEGPTWSTESTIICWLSVNLSTGLYCNTKLTRKSPKLSFQAAEMQIASGREVDSGCRKDVEILFIFLTRVELNGQFDNNSLVQCQTFDRCVGCEFKTNENLQTR